MPTFPTPLPAIVRCKFSEHSLCGGWEGRQGLAGSFLQVLIPGFLPPALVCSPSPLFPSGCPAVCFRCFSCLSWLRK